MKFIYAVAFFLASPVMADSVADAQVRVEGMSDATLLRFAADWVMDAAQGCAMFMTPDLAAEMRADVTRQVIAQGDNAEDQIVAISAYLDNRYQQLFGGPAGDAVFDVIYTGRDLFIIVRDCG